jgi:protease-4
VNANYKYLALGVYCLVSAPVFSQHVYLELNLNNQSTQSRVRSVRPRSMLETFRVIERAGEDKRIRGIILNISAFSAGSETIWELRNSLERFKSKGKKICAFISAADLDLYGLAAMADKIVMDGQGALALTGYVWGRAFARNTLDKLGVGVRELRYLQYKSAAETFTRSSISEADRRQYGEYLDDTFAVTRINIMNGRAWTAEEFNTVVNREFLYSAKTALERKLVDRVGRAEAVEEALKELEGGEVKHFVLYGDSDSSLMESKSSYGPGKSGGLFSRPPVIAVVYANGQTDMERGMAARSLAHIIREAADNRRVKAIVLRVNSPGGSAEAADYIAEAVKYAKEEMKKPVVVSMGSVAASGGYWASMYASHIMATPYTLTGSIGVIGSWFYDKGLNSKLGLTVDVLQRGSHADLGSGIILPRRDLTQEEEQRYRGYILDMYADFTAKVAGGRNMTLEQVEAAAQGRVFSGIGARNAGLVDSIGGVADAVRLARELAKIPDRQKTLFREYPKPKFIDKLLERLPGNFAGSFTSLFGGRLPAAAPVNAANFLSDLFIPAPLLEDLRFRLEHNGQVMPILPIDNGMMRNLFLP